MSTVLTVVHVVACFFLILVVLLQAGKGGGMGLAFGGSSSGGAVFGGSGAGNFLSRLTAIMAGVFMLTSVTLAYIASQTGADALAAHSKRSRSRASASAKMKAEYEAAGKDLERKNIVPPVPMPDPSEVLEDVAPQGANPGAVPNEATPPKPAGAKPAGAKPAGAKPAGAKPAGAKPAVPRPAPVPVMPAKQPAQPAAP